jgi:hypothetical protein
MMTSLGLSFRSAADAADDGKPPSAASDEENGLSQSNVRQFAQPVGDLLWRRTSTPDF